jgi:hypothetical protein
MINDFDAVISAWFALIVVLNRTEPIIQAVLNIARYAKNLDIDKNAADANCVCVASAAHQDPQQPSVLRQHAAIAAARLTKAL